jgi:hypothetical protein
MLEKETDEFKVSFRNDGKTKQWIYERVYKFFLDQQCFHKETVQQSDRVIENAYEFLADLVDALEFEVEWKDDV